MPDKVPKIKVTPVVSTTSKSKDNNDENSNNGGHLFTKNTNISYLTPHFLTKGNQIDPFRHRLNLGFFGYIRVFIMSLTLAPIRFMCVIFLLSFAAFVSRIGLMCAGDPDARPFRGCRKSLQKFVLKIARAVFFCMGFHHVSIIGTQATREEAPVLVAAPHSTFVDALAIVLSKSVPVAKKGLSQVWFVGAIGRFMQVLFVSRESASSRSKVTRQIKSRALDMPNIVSLDDEEETPCCTCGPPADWPQILLFPEGTNTNAKALIKFKSGAFQVGAPVQPVLIRLQSLNGTDTYTWTWNQSYGAFACLWLTLCQFRSKMSIEFLPVYKPTEVEIDDPRIFAGNVRRRMATRLGIPEVDRSVNEWRPDFEKSTENLSGSTNDLRHQGIAIERAPAYVVDFVGNLTQA